MFEKGDELAAVEALEEVWSNLTSDDQIFTWNPLPSSIFHGASLTNSDPLRNLIGEIMDKYGPTKRKFILGTTNFDNGEHEVFDETLSSKD